MTGPVTLIIFSKRTQQRLENSPFEENYLVPPREDFELYIVEIQGGDEVNP